MPYWPGGDYIVESWRQVGVTATQTKLGTREWQAALEKGEFDVAIDFGGDYFDDPSLQLVKFVSRDLSPANYSGSRDSFLDALYIGQAITTDRARRTGMVRDFERRALTEAATVPFLWWNRIIANSSRLKGWNITPSHYIHQDLVDVWLASR
jgi:peptide/nickel transport system substrate-binding protein